MADVRRPWTRTCAAGVVVKGRGGEGVGQNLPLAAGQADT